MPFLGAQAFFINPGTVANAPEVGISGVDLFFKAKPNANNNASGVSFPSVQVSLVPCINTVPDVTQMLTAPSVRASYTDIQTDPKANVACRFEFLPPVQVSSNAFYAFVVYADDPNYVLWGETIGQPLLGTNIICTGPSGPYVGNFFDFVSATPNIPGGNGGSLILGGNTQIFIPANTVTGNSGFPTSATILGSWAPRTAFDLKFTLYAARYSFNGNNQLSFFVNNSAPANAQITFPTNVVVNSISGETVFTAPAGRYEYISYATGNSSNVGVLVGERIFQNTVFYPGGTANPIRVAVAAGSNTLTLVNSTALNWTTLLTVGSADPEYIVVTSGNAQGPNASLVNVRQVTSYISNSQITVDEPWTFTNNQAYFFRTPIAEIDQWLSGRIFGVHSDVMVASHATANQSMRFVNDSILDVSINAIGVGYSNTDYFEVSGFESVAGKVIGGFIANGNINTFANGSLSNLYMANLGCGFVNSSTIAVTVKAANGAASNGSGATFGWDVGSTIVGEFLGQTGSGGYFVECKIINIDIGNEVPGPGINNPATTQYHATQYLPYYSLDDTATVFGRVYYSDIAANADIVPVQFGTMIGPWQFTKRRAAMSWSNELITPYANGLNANGGGGFTDGRFLPLTSNCSVLIVNAVSNSDFGSVSFAPRWSAMTFSRFIINDDYTGENTNQGNAWAKGIELSFNLANSNLAEDLVIYSSCYRPQVANIIMYARLYNSSDPDLFHDKEWTMLQVDSGGEVFSSPIDPNTIQELTWGLQPTPNNTTLSGFVTTSTGDPTIAGVGTTFVADLSVGDLVIIFQPLFASSDYWVTTVNSIVSNVQLTVTTTTANNDVLGAGMRIAKINYPHQAFTNPQNSGIVRYYNSQQVPFDGYDVAQLKAVMISSNGVVVPIITDIRMVAVSA